MIRSYRSKRRKIQEELSFLNSHKIPNEELPTINDNVISPRILSTSDKLNISGLINLEHILNDNVDAEENNIILDNSNNSDIESNKISISDTPEYLKSKIANWVIQCNVPHTTANILLSILKEHKCLKSFPIDCRTLLHSTSSKITNVRFLNPGHYFHFGLRDGIEKCSQRYSIGDEIKIIVGIDGLNFGLF